MQLAIVAMISKATLSHVTATFREERRYFVLGRELASIGFGQAVFNVLHLPRLHLQIFPQSLDRQETFCSTGRFRQRVDLGRHIKRNASIDGLLCQRCGHDSWPYGRGLQKVFYTCSVRITTAKSNERSTTGRETHPRWIVVPANAGIRAQNRLQALKPAAPFAPARQRSDKNCQSEKVLVGICEHHEPTF